jgi:hypothetical protein
MNKLYDKWRQIPKTTRLVLIGTAIILLTIIVLSFFIPSSRVVDEHSDDVDLQESLTPVIYNINDLSKSGLSRTHIMTVESKLTSYYAIVNEQQKGQLRQIKSVEIDSISSTINSDGNYVYSGRIVTNDDTDNKFLYITAYSSYKIKIEIGNTTEDLTTI